MRDEWDVGDGIGDDGGRGSRIFEYVLSATKATWEEGCPIHDERDFED